MRAWTRNNNTLLGGGFPILVQKGNQVHGYEFTLPVALIYAIYMVNKVRQLQLYSMNVVFSTGVQVSLWFVWSLHRRGRGSIPRLGSNFLVMKNTDVIPAGQIPHIDDYPMHVCDQSMESALRGQQLLLAYEQNYQVTPWKFRLQPVHTCTLRLHAELTFHANINKVSLYLTHTQH